MKILLDECTPSVVKKRLPHRDIRTVQEMGWNGVKNGELLAAAEGQFDIFITTDKNLRYQQNLTRCGFAVVLLPSNQVPVVEALISTIEAKIDSLQAGDFLEIPFAS
jgi:predicted nuclease of predicted toxin-antitoxin system